LILAPNSYTQSPIPNLQSPIPILKDHLINKKNIKN